MTAKEFEDALVAINWRKVDFCRAVEIDPSTVSRWMADQPIPAWVPAHLALLGDLQTLHDRYLAPPPKPGKVAA